MSPYRIPAYRKPSFSYKHTFLEKIKRFFWARAILKRGRFKYRVQKCENCGKRYFVAKSIPLSFVENDELFYNLIIHLRHLREDHIRSITTS